MKIKDVEIMVVKGDVARFRADEVVVLSAKQEKGLRRACAKALQAADSRGSRSIAFPVIGCSKERGAFPPLASAKIMAQEAFRYAQREKCAVKKIYFVISGDEESRIFRKTVDGYLSYILHKLSAGPFITVDTIIEVGKGVVLIKRSNPPFGWAIPGGFVDYGETLEKAAAREAKEETGLVVKNLKQMHTYSDPGRDPRFHTITTVFICQARGNPKGASDALEAKIFKPGELKNVELAFDHKKVLGDYLRYKRRD